MLGLNDEAIAQLQEPALSGYLRLGTPSEFATTLLPRVVGRFARAYPHVALEVECDLSKNLLAPDRRGEFDLVLALQDSVNQDRAGLVKVLKVLEQHGLDWQIAYTNPDLTGLQAAIEEGLGVTVLARSAVPPNLQVLPPGERLPALGEVGISLNYDRRRNDEALVRLAEFIGAGLAPPAPEGPL
jgi:DNA-binding transcriptional LysR family regulator